MILGLVCFCLNNRDHFAHRFGEGFDVRSYLRQAIALVERGLVPGPDDQAAEDRSPAGKATVKPD